MVYNRYEDTIVATDFEVWFDELTRQKKGIVDDILPEVLGSGLHEYNGVSTDWRFTHTGRGYF